MKLIKSFLLATILMAGITAQAQITEGKVKATMSFDSMDPDVKSQLAMLGEMDITTYFKGNKSRVEQSGSMTGTNITIFDGDANESVLLMSNPFLGKKYIKMSGEDMDKQKEDEDDVDVEKTDETKKILDHECTKYIISTDEQDIIMWVANDLNIPGGKNNYGIDGYPLRSETELSQMGMKMTMVMEVTEIVEEKVSRSKFDMSMPEGYEEGSMDELQSMGGM